MFFVIEETKETVLDFSQGTIKILWAWFNFDQYKMTQYNNLNVKLSNSQLKVCNEKWNWSSIKIIIKHNWW